MKSVPPFACSHSPETRARGSPGRLVRVPRARIRRRAHTATPYLEDVCMPMARLPEKPSCEWGAFPLKTLHLGNEAAKTG